MDPETRMQFAAECEEAKRQLSEKPQTPITLYFEGKTLTVNLTRTDFERMTGDLMQRTRDTTELVLQQAGIEMGQLEVIVLVGGSTHMPAVSKMLKEVSGKAPSRTVDPETAVAQGAAIHAAILEARLTDGQSKLGQTVANRLRSVKATDVNSHSLGVEISNPADRTRKVNHIMIPKNSTIPYSISQRFVTNVANQQRVHVKLLQGEASDVSACTLIGDFRITDLPPNLPAGSPVELTYRYDSTGRIVAEAKELTGGRGARAEIVRDSGLTDTNVDAFEMLAKDYTVE